MTIKTIEQLVTLLQPKTFNDMVREHLDNDFEWDYNAKTFNEMNVDDLDMVEVIMNIEKEYDCEIPDDLGDYMFSMDPQLLMRSYIRNKRIEELGL
jgi:acyl carrier protein